MIVVNVNPTGSADISTGITLTEYETVYYTRSVNGIVRNENDQYAAYTFTPSVTNGTLAEVAIHEPVGSSDSWNDTWTAIEGQR